jgi:glycine oxidase
MAEHPDVLVFGGGVIGLSCAYFLAREGVRVEVVDKGDFGQEASWAGAGILAAGNPPHARTPYDLLRAHSVTLFPTLSAELRERTGIDNGYRRCGGLEIVGPGDTDADEWRAEQIPFTAPDEGELKHLAPGLHTPSRGRVYYLPDMAQVRNPRHIKALLAGCAGHSVRLRAGCPVNGFERRGERIAAVHTSLETLTADRFLLATGAWSEPLLHQLGLSVGIHPVRGQIVLLNTRIPQLTRVVVHGKRYLVPRPDGRVLVGSTEEDVGFDKRTTAEAISGLLAFALELCPYLKDAMVERCWAGLRPGSPDEQPFLGTVPGCSNLFIAAGHFRSGIQLSPATGLVMKELLLGQPLTVPLESFRVDRIAAAPRRPAFRS